MQRVTSCLCHMPGWHTPSGLGRTRSPLATPHRRPAMVHSSAHTHPFTECTRQDTEQRAWLGHGQQHTYSSEGAHRHMHTHRHRAVNAAARCTSSALPAHPRESTHTHAQPCTHINTYVYVHTCTYAHTHPPIYNYTCMQMQSRVLTPPHCPPCSLPSPCKASWCRAVPCKSSARVPTATNRPCRAGGGDTQHYMVQAAAPLCTWHSPWHGCWL